MREEESECQIAITPVFYKYLEINLQSIRLLEWNKII